MNNEQLDGMDRYLVFFVSNVTASFLCWADDSEHALEQAENAYPEDRVYNIFKLGPMVYKEGIFYK